LDVISVCQDGYSQEAYEKYRVGGDVGCVKAGIAMVMAYKRAHRCDHPALNVYTLTFRHVQPEIDMIKHFCSEQGVDQLQFRPDQFNWDGSSVYRPHRRPYGKCFWPWLTTTIDTDGSVYPCGCRYPFEKWQPYGNLKKQTFEEIWNGVRYVETRQFLTGRTPKRAELNLPCYTCQLFGEA
jgi:radical SAM protein with 4Fe4S-binding SPASM domain